MPDENGVLEHQPLNQTLCITLNYGLIIWRNPCISALLPQELIFPRMTMTRKRKG